MHERLLSLFQRAGVKVVFSGHEHNFQHSLVDGIHYFVTGAAAKLRTEAPDRFDDARTRSWSTSCHFLMVEVARDRMIVRAIGELGPGAALTDIPRLDPRGASATEPMVIGL
jgi:predicted phosphodiesterase